MEARGEVENDAADMLVLAPGVARAVTVEVVDAMDDVERWWRFTSLRQVSDESRI